MQACNSRTREVEAGEEVQGHPWLNSELDTSLGCRKVRDKERRERLGLFGLTVETDSLIWKSKLALA